MAEALDGAYPALARLRADGTVGAIGVGVNSASVAEWFVARCDLDCVLVAGRYTLLDDSAAASLFPLCLARGVAMLAAGVPWPGSAVTAHSTEASHCSTPAMCTVAHDLAISGSWAASASRMARCSASV